MNPVLNIMQMFKNPQALVRNMMQNQQIMNSPLGNAVNAANKGDQKTLEEIARNMCKEKGINPDDAFNQVKQMMNGNMPKQ